MSQSKIFSGAFPLPICLKDFHMTERRETAFLSALEVRRFLEVLGERWRAFLTTSALTGMRLGEMLAMRWDNLDTDEGIYTVRDDFRHLRAPGAGDVSRDG